MVDSEWTDPRHVFPADVLAHAKASIADDGINITLAEILEGRLAAMHYQWTWDDCVCAPESLT